MLLGPCGLGAWQGAGKFSRLPHPRQGSRSPPGILPREMLPGVTVWGQTQEHPGLCSPARSRLSPAGGWAVGTALSPTLSLVGPTRAGLGPSAMPPPPIITLPTTATKLGGTVTEGLVGLQLGGRKERKANQRRKDDPVFPRSAPSAPGTTGCPSTTVPPPRDRRAPSLAAWPHSDPLPPSSLRCHLGHTQTLVYCKPPGWQPAGTPGTPLLLPTYPPAPVTSGARSQLGEEELCTLCLNGTLPCWLLWGEGPSPPGITPDGPKERAALEHHWRRV